ncbi:MAG: host attachment protein [Aestuariivirga sp.]
MKPTRTWVLIADGARARILESTGSGHGLEPVAGMTFNSDHSATHDLVTEREGRGHSSVGEGRYAVASHSDPHRELKVKFARQLADVLASALERKAYDRLVVAASPVTLGDLRMAMPAGVRAKVSGEIAHDLTKVPNDEVAGHLTSVLAA